MSWTLPCDVLCVGLATARRPITRDLWTALEGSVTTHRGRRAGSLLPRCYQDRTNQSHQAPCREHPVWWFPVGLGWLRLDFLKFVNRRSSRSGNFKLEGSQRIRFGDPIRTRTGKKAPHLVINPYPGFTPGSTPGFGPGSGSTTIAIHRAQTTRTR